ncbi:phosphotransferase [Paenibacillus sp. MMS20-IR301]|uniref:phosphotransferase n=1 Tax=Paenibacillus sp. MMS20-IR301 TaxID=2895946 RepID=UPI0028E49B14|nr:phosphotransferase [Paenibacillus sp. MMS20-IR301]WNS46893.1 phosphotransferase [Paenibacillus sp. MMS20-IR301]
MRNVFGAKFVVAGVMKMHGGAQKLVYKIDCTNGFSCVLYVWDVTKNYFEEEIAGNTTHSQSYGSNLFEVNNRYLTAHSIRTPVLYNLNQERSRYPFDYALVEYTGGQSAEAYFSHGDTQVKDTVFLKLGDMISEMHADESNIYGKPNQTSPNEEQCHLIHFVSAEAHLSYASEHVDTIRKNRDKLVDISNRLAAKIEPRNRYGYIHGELGPNHVIILENLEPCLIDIEGAGFFDIEYEHSFMKFRFGELYQYLGNERLDPDRMLFYQYHHHLSLIAAGLKLVHREYPDQQTARNIAEYHTMRALQFLESY